MRFVSWQQPLQNTKLVSGFVSVIALLGFIWLSQSFSFHERIFDRLQVFHWTIFGNDAPEPNVWIVEIDDQALQREETPWPYPRETLADLVDIISRKQPSAIGLDIFLAGKSPDELADQWLEVTLNNTPNLVLAHIQADNDWTEFERLSEIPPTAPVVFAKSHLRELLLHTTHPLIPSSLEIDRSAAGHGFINDDWFEEGQLRLMPPIVATKRAPIAAFALEVSRVAIGADSYILSPGHNGGVTLTFGGATAKQRELRLDQRFAIRPRLRPENRAQYVSAKSVLDDGGAEVFQKGDIALIGATALGTGDIITTAFGEIYGIDAHAQILETILRDDSWLRPSYLQPLEWAAAFSATATALALVSLPILTALVLSLALVVGAIAAAITMMAIGGLLFDPSLIIVGVVAVFLTSSIGRLQNERLRRRHAENQKLAFETELELARGIQSSILVDPGQIDGLPSSVELEAELVQSNFVGGDFFDAFMIEDNRLFFVVADVSGKGWSGAFFMAIAKAFIQSGALKAPKSVAQIVRSAEIEIGRNNPHELFVTAIVGILDIDTGEIELCNAGHPPPIVLTPGEPATSLTTADAPPIGMLPGFDFNSSRHQLRNGQSLLLFTDGLADLTDQELGHSMQDLRSFLDRLQADNGRLPSARELVELANAQKVIAPDDVTLLMIKYA